MTETLAPPMTRAAKVSAQEPKTIARARPMTTASPKTIIISATERSIASTVLARSTQQPSSIAPPMKWEFVR